MTRQVFQRHVMCLTCHAMRSLSLMSLSLSSGCSCMYSSVKNAWRKTHTSASVLSVSLCFLTVSLWPSRIWRSRPWRRDPRCHWAAWRGGLWVKRRHTGTGWSWWGFSHWFVPSSRWRSPADSPSSNREIFTNYYYHKHVCSSMQINYSNNII